MVVYEPLQQYDTAHTAKTIYRKPWAKHGSSIDENSVLNYVYGPISPGLIRPGMIM